MEHYDPSRIGQCISLLFGEHTVYRYGESEVIKFSHVTHLLRDNEINYLRRDIEIGEKYFGEYMVPTRIATRADGKRPVLIQPFVHGRILEKSDLKNPALAQQYRDIINRHRRLLEDGHPAIDLMSGIGFLLGKPRNIYLTDEGMLRLIDVTSVEMFSAPFRAWVERRQSAMLERYVGM